MNFDSFIIMHFFLFVTKKGITDFGKNMFYSKRKIEEKLIFLFVFCTLVQIAEFSRIELRNISISKRGRRKSNLTFQEECSLIVLNFLHISTTNYRSCCSIHQYSSTTSIHKILIIFPGISLASNFFWVVDDEIS